MGRSVGAVIALAVLMLGGMFLWMSLQAKSVQTQTDRINQHLDMVEKDMGVYNPDSARATPVTKRALKVTREMQQRAEANRRLLDSLTRAERMDLGDHTLTDSSGFPDDH